MPAQWELYTDKISSYYLSALINGDYTGIPDYERQAFDAWREGVEQQARDDGWTVGHWTSDSDDEGDDWGICSVSNLRAGRVLVTLMVYKD
jgi:hypothetical protein